MQRSLGSLTLKEIRKKLEDEFQQCQLWNMKRLKPDTQKVTQNFWRLLYAASPTVTQNFWRLFYAASPLLCFSCLHQELRMLSCCFK